MEITIQTRPYNGQEIAFVTGDTDLLATPRDSLDLLADVSYQTGCDRMILQKVSVCEAFFDLKNGIAGEVLQKFINYRMKLAIVGDYSGYTSKALRDFIRESNRGKDICFVPDEQQAIDFLMQE